MANPDITLIVSCSIFPEQFKAFIKVIEDSQALERVEIILVAQPHCDYGPLLAPGYAGVQRVIVTPREPLNAARARAAHLASADIIVFAEDHAHLHGPWLKVLTHLYRETDHAAIGWTIRPGNLVTLASWTGYLVEYGWWAPGLPTGARVTHLAGHNSSYRKSALLAFSEQLSTLMLSEGVLHWEMRKQGLSLFFTAELHSRHFEPCTLRELWGADFWYGWNFANARQRRGRWSYLRRLLMAAAIWAKPIVRWLELLAVPRDADFFPRGILRRCAPAITATYLIATLGECLGHLFGAWRAPQKLEYYEIETDRRVRV